VTAVVAGGVWVEAPAKGDQMQDAGCRIEQSLVIADAFTV